ncbi:12513_t:CDS:1 [Funneliformis geosporum]|uniref:12513_t:CDS:1 n=1 Tax=Funneliformis geosporum TaxID=1117311 RepID=A0A9W4SEP1_9GLOM|nr:12513_t:CDS:1 [Funneliformis geosporum]
MHRINILPIYGTFDFGICLLESGWPKMNLGTNVNFMRKVFIVGSQQCKNALGEIVITHLLTTQELSSAPLQIESKTTVLNTFLKCQECDKSFNENLQRKSIHKM